MNLRKRLPPTSRRHDLNDESLWNMEMPACSCGRSRLHVPYSVWDTSVWCIPFYYNNKINQVFSSNNDNIDSLRDIIGDVKDYAALRLKLLRYDFASKLIALSAGLLLTVILLVLFAVALLFLSGMLALVLSGWIGSLAGACALVGGVCLLLGVLIYAFRTRLIVRPLAAFVGRVLLDDDKEI